MAPGKKKDVQKGGVRKSEAKVFGEREPNLPTLEACQEYVIRIMTSKWFKNLKPQFTSVVFKDGRRVSHIECRFERVGALGTMGVIDAPRNTRIDWMILHTLCHLLSWRGEPHDRNWCRLYLSAVKRWMGVEDYRALRAAFVKYHVHWQQPRTNPWNKTDTANRMAELREKKRLKQLIAVPTNDDVKG